jgi:hypothetical protein
MSVIDPNKLQKLSVTEREAIKQQIASQEEQLDNPERLAISGQNATSEMKENVLKKKIILQKDDDLIARGTEKDRLFARLKEIELILIPNMPTKNQMWAKSGTEESDRAVQKNLLFRSKYGKLASEWQNIKKRLEPDDPWAQSLDSIRPEK